MFLQPLDLTTALRPLLWSDETLLFVQDNVGLYEGKYKIAESQNGSAYLTTHRACYVDSSDPRRYSVALELKNVEKCDFYAGFLKSSAKVTIYAKPGKRSTIYNALGGRQIPAGDPNAPTSPYNATSSSNIGSASPALNKATWVCTICSFSNPVPANFDAITARSNAPLPPCSTCGIKPSFSHVLKAAISAASGRTSSPATSNSAADSSRAGHFSYASHLSAQTAATSDSSDRREPGKVCPRCTFLNHPSLHACEMCGASLLPGTAQLVETNDIEPAYPTSPAYNIEGKNTLEDDDGGSIKFSFRMGGEKVFYDRLRGALTQRKWLLQSAPPIPAPVDIDTSRSNDLGSPQHFLSSKERTSSPGIAGLERRELELRRKNEAVIGSAFSDLDALRASAKEIIALAETFAGHSSASPSLTGGSTDPSQIIAESARALEMVTTKDVAGGKGGNSLYLSEISRNLAEYLTDDARGILRHEGGIMSLVDLWATYNRVRNEGGVDFVSPREFDQAARLWEKLHLPVRLRQFKNGLMVVQQADRTDDKTIAQLLNWMRGLHGPAGALAAPPLSWGAPEENDFKTAFGWDVERFGRGVTAQETAQHFNWSVGVANEELEMAEDKGALCRDEEDESGGAATFWENWIVELEEEDDDDFDASCHATEWENGDYDDDEVILQNFKDTGLM